MSMFSHFSLSKSQNKTAWLGMITIGILFGRWFALQQINAVSPDVASTYPTLFYSLTILKCLLTIIALNLFSQVCLTGLIHKSFKISQIVILYTPLLLVYLHVPLLWIAGLIITLHLSLAIRILSKSNAYQLLRQYQYDIGAICVYFIAHLLLTSRFSPLHWKNAILVAKGYNAEEIPVLAPIFKGYVLAKHFSFSFIDHSQWAGIMNPPGTLYSPLLQLITLVFDLPSVSYESFHVLMMATYFFLAIAGSFGIYLFLKYGARIHPLFAFFGGALFFFSGDPLLEGSFTSDGGIFLPAQVVFIYALLFIKLAFDKNSNYLAAWAGLTLAAQFFILAPHPESTIYALLFYTVFAGGMFLFTPAADKKKQIILVAISYLTYFLLSSYYVMPIIIDRLRGNMYVFAHVSDIGPTVLEYFYPYMHVLYVLIPISFAILWMQKKLTSVYLSCLLLILSLYGFLVLTANIAFTTKLVTIFHIGLHFWVAPRIGMYFCISAYLFIMIALNAVSDACIGFINRDLRAFKLLER